MFAILDDLEQSLSQLEPDELAACVVVEQSPDYPGCLVFQPLSDPGIFYHRYDDWISRHLILNELHMLDRFTEQLEEDGLLPVFASNAQGVLDDHARWSAPLTIEGYELHSFQQYGISRYLERARTGNDNSERFSFWNWSAGSGKSFTSGAAARSLFDSGDIDLVIACTLSKLKENLRRTYVDDAGLATMINDHADPETRRKRYSGSGIQAFVMNYEKLWVDFDALAELVSGKRVVYVLDEGHKLINDGAHNKSRKALDALTKGQHAVVWPMSATVVGGNPLRFRDVFSLDGRSRNNPLGTKKDFVDLYASKVRNIPLKTRQGGRFTLTTYDWDLSKLQDIRHRIGDRAMAVRKTDPGVREQFKGIDCLPEIIQPTDAALDLFGAITERAAEAKEREESLAPYYLALRIAAINPEALLLSDSEVVYELVEELPKALFSAKHSAKIEVLNDKLESIREAQDKAVVFCHWTELGILPLAQHIAVPHVLHYGVGQSNKESQAAQDKFKTDPDVTAFVSSDAGTHGLNMQVSRYVINVDPTYSYDDLAQRNARIDRADSHLSGLTSYILILEGSVEERVWEICNQRREISEAVQGTKEALSYEGGVSAAEMNNLDWLIFGAR